MKKWSQKGSGEEVSGYSSCLRAVMPYLRCLPDELFHLGRRPFRLKKLGGNAKCMAVAVRIHHNRVKSFFYNSPLSLRDLQMNSDYWI